MATLMIKYFAYGSNLSSARLLERIPGAKPGPVATLTQHRLCFQKNDRGESGKCDIQHTSLAEDLVYGVLYYLTPSEKEVLDGYETQGFGYLDKQVEVTTLAGEMVVALTYYAVDIDQQQQPYHWYKHHVLHGAREHRFPAAYIAAIERVTSIDDTDVDRESRELAIYAGES